MKPFPERAGASLRSRLLAYLLVPLLALLAISLAVDYLIAFSLAEGAYDYALLSDILALSRFVRVEGSLTQVDVPPEVAAIIHNDELDEEFFAVFGPQGELLAGRADLSPEPLEEENTPFFSDGVLAGKPVRKATQWFKTPNGWVAIVVAETTRQRDAVISRMLFTIAIPSILVIVSTLLLVHFGVRRGLAPLTRLGEAIARRTPRDLTPLPADQVPAEATPLVAAMDGLIGDLREAALAQQAFLANAAHQLKTPLAGLQTQLDLAAAEFPDEFRKRVLRLRDSTQRLTHLAHQLLALARSAPEAQVAHPAYPVDLTRLLTEKASTWFDRALTAGMELEFDPQPAIMEGAEWLLGELLDNLVDNALKYTPTGGKITVCSGTGIDGRAFVEVEDDGPGIPEPERQRVFERFYRLHAVAAEGAGLGLSIVKEVADRHGAAITVADAGPGTRLRVTFPPSDQV